MGLRGWVCGFGSLAVLAGCSSSSGSVQPGGSATVNATIQGATFQAQDAWSGVGIADGGGYSFAGVMVANFKNSCVELSSASQPAGAAIIEITVDPGVAGTFPIATVPAGGHTNFAQALYISGCGNGCYSKATNADRAASGTVTLTAVNTSAIEGSFDLIFPGGDHATGTFSAPACNVPSSNGC